jgi:pyruvate dehydrogenase E2 component (dihydrolipoamide acetyltransferase)
MSAASDIVMPKLGLTMTEGLLAEWRVVPGSRVSAGEVLFVVETEKIASDVEAPAAGEIRELLVEAGATVPIGTPVARWSGEPGIPVAGPERAADSPAPMDGPRILATPLARRLAKQAGIDLRRVPGSGPKGRVKAIDVTRAGEATGPAALPAHARPAAAPGPVRAAAARRLGQSKRDIPHFYVGQAAEVSRLLLLREELNARTDLPHITLTHAVMAATGRALLELPVLNRVWEEEGWRRLEESDVGLAVDTPRGLLAPVLRDVGRAPLDDVAARTAGLATRAREGRLALEDLAGGSITVSNLGMHGPRFLVPIVNPGQSMILGVGAVEALFRPDANGAPTLRREITLVLAADHRVLDGAEAAALVACIARHLERPFGLLRPAPDRRI